MPTVLLVGAALVVLPVGSRVGAAFGAPVLALPLGAGLLAVAGATVGTGVLDHLRLVSAMGAGHE